MDRMRTPLGLCILFLLTGCSSLSFTEGTYVGSVFNGNAPTPAITTFYPRALDEQKTQYGTFAYMEDKSWVPGTISDCQEMPDRRVACLWHDKYGLGIMQVQFDVAYRSFEGNWGPLSSRPLKPRRQRSLPEREALRNFIVKSAQRLFPASGEKKTACHDAYAQLIWNGTRADSAAPDAAKGN